MKILFVAHEADLNGSSKSLLNLIDVLSSRHEIYVLTSYQEGRFAEEIKKHNCTVWVSPYYRWVKTKSSRKNWYKNKIRWYCYEQWVTRRTAKKIADKVKQEGIQLVHSNTRVINVGGLTARYAGIPHIWHFREYGEEDFNMYPVMSEEKHYGQISRMADAVIAISDAIQKKFRNLLPEQVPMFKVYNGVDSSNLNQKAPYIPEQVSFLISGRISETKGQKEVLQAILQLMDEGYYNFKVYMAGSKSEGYELFDADTEQAKPFVELLGQISDMPALRSRMDVELVCSKAEAFGRVTVEAMMSSMSVIGSCAGGTKELITNGQNGYLYEQGSVASLAQCMKHYLDEPELVFQLGSLAYEYAHEYFLIERCAKEIEAVYHTVI